jgi:hypothetical protein
MRAGSNRISAALAVAAPAWCPAGYCSGTESGDELDLDRNAERQLGEADR